MSRLKSKFLFIVKSIFKRLQPIIHSYIGYDFDEAVKALSLHTHKKAKMVKRDIYIQLKSGEGKYGKYSYLSIIDANGRDVDLTLDELINSRYFLVEE